MQSMDVEYMFKLGLHSVENILGTPDEELLGLPGITEENIEVIRETLARLQEKQEKEEFEIRQGLAAARQAAAAAAAAAEAGILDRAEGAADDAGVLEEGIDPQEEPEEWVEGEELVVPEEELPVDDAVAAASDTDDESHQP